MPSFTVTGTPSVTEVMVAAKLAPSKNEARRLIAGRAETENNGQIVASITNTILQPTTFSSVK